MVRLHLSGIMAIVISIVIFIISWINVSDWTSVGIFHECSYSNRFIYPLFHANPLHAALNAWCLLSVVYYYRTSVTMMAISYLVAVFVPNIFLSDLATVGLSGAIYCLYGSITFKVQRKLYYQTYMLVYLALGFIFPKTNVLIHIYCYVVGVLIALLNKHIRITSKNKKQ